MKLAWYIIAICAAPLVPFLSEESVAGLLRKAGVS